MFRRSAVLAVVAWLAACQGEEPDKPAGVGNGSGGRGGASAGSSNTGGQSRGGVGGVANGGRSGRGGSAGSAAEGGEGGEAGSEAGAGGSTGGAAGRGGAGGSSGESPATGGRMVEPCSSDDTGLPPAALTFACDPRTVWGGESEVLSDGVPEDRLIAVTPDELTITWFSATGAAGRYYVADRADAADAFGARVEVSSYVVVGLSPDGLRLVVLTEARDGFAELVRDTRGDAFEVYDDSAFADVNAALAEEDMNPVTALVGPDERTLYYTVVATTGLRYPLFVSKRTGTVPWPAGEPVKACELAAEGPYTRIPTGLSSDGLTLFFFDAARDIARAAFRETQSHEYSWFIDLPDFYRPQVNAACDRVYYSSYSDVTGLLFADAQ